MRNYMKYLFTISFLFLFFGGQIVNTIKCSCDEGKYLISVFPGTGTDFIVTKQTQLKSKGGNDLRAGRWVLGIANFGMSSCRVGKGKTCVTMGTGRTLRLLGVAGL